MAKKPAPPKVDPAGAGLLERWRERAKLSQTDAAKLIGIDLARYNAIEHSRIRPGLDWAVRIEEATKGAVPAEVWAKDPRALAS